MQPPSARDPLRWIDQRWDAIGKIFPSFIMDWLYQQDGADRLKHHRWMLTRPTFLSVALSLHQSLADDGDIIIANVITPDARFKFPDGTQRALALRFFRRLQRADGAEVAVFLVATACELLGLTPLCAYKDAALESWLEGAIAEAVPGTYGNVYNLLVNVITQTMLFVLGCLPYTALQQQTAPSAISFGIDLGDGQHRPGRHRSEVNNRLLLKQYTLTLNEQLKRISRHPPAGRTYHESETDGL